jgi:DUF1009 family protein
MRWRDVCQTFIVDGGVVLMPEIQTEGTNQLIRRLGASSHRRTSKFPAFCKVAAAPFEKLDVPTIGINTALICIENMIRSIVVGG